MVKSGKYEVKQPNIFGRIGTGIGKGFNEQFPKEMERGRLASGLQQFEQESGNLNPLQQFTKLAAIPGITPQMIQALPEILKQQQFRDAYKRGNNPSIQNTGGIGSQGNPPQDFLQNQLQSGGLSSQGNQTIPSNLPRYEEAMANPPAASENPLDQKFIPPNPWNQQRHEEAINEAFDRGIARTFDEANNYANAQREIYERSPEEYRKQLDYKKSIDKQVDDLFDKQMQTRLQKEGPETFKDLSGDFQLNIKKLARNAVATGKMTPEQAAEYYSKKGLDLVKDKGEALKIANRDIWDRLLPHKKEETIKKLKHIAKNFDEMGNSEDFFNFLTTDSVDDSGKQSGMGLSAGGAAIIQYPRTENVKNLIRNTKISSKNPLESTRSFAQNLFKEMTPNDSFLAIARQMKQQDPNFDEYAFFDYLRENKDFYGTNKRLDREVSKGVSDFLPNWRDIGLFPSFSKSVAND